LICEKLLLVIRDHFCRIIRYKYLIELTQYASEIFPTSLNVAIANSKNNSENSRDCDDNIPILSICNIEEVEGNNESNDEDSITPFYPSVTNKTSSSTNKISATNKKLSVFYSHFGMIFPAAYNQFGGCR
jgi:hypothetical protein